MKEKNRAAVALGRRGGRAKNAKLTEEQRKDMMAEVRKAKGVPPKIYTLKVPCPKDARLQTGMNTPRINDGERHWHSLPSYLEPPGKPPEPPGGSFSFARASLNSLTASIVSSHFLCAASFTSARSRLSDRLSLLSLIVLAASRTFYSLL